MNVLYLSYDGALDPLGRSQVIPYLEALSRRGHRFDLITFEKEERWKKEEERQELQARLENEDIHWYPLPYHRRPSALATAYDLFQAYRRALSLWPRRRWALIHSRSYPCTLVARWLRKRLGIPYLFDMRGFYPEERVDGGLWARNGFLFRLAKKREEAFLREAAGVVTLTEASLPALRELMARVGSRALLRVIPTSVDLKQFAPSEDGSRGRSLAYIGSLGTWYLLEEMLALGREALEEIPDLNLLFLVNDEEGRLVRIFEGSPLPRAQFEVRSVSHEEVPKALSGVAATFFLIAPAPSKLASAPTKFAESLALGLPVVVNRGVGDSATVVDEEEVGVVVEELTPRGYREAARRLRDRLREPGIGERCRRVAQDRYDLEKAAEAYAGLYRQILEGVTSA